MTQPHDRPLDDDGYPFEDDLVRIAKWPGPAFAGLMEFVRARWIYEDYWRQESDIEKRRYFASTGGWSGHESLIDALRTNHVFWSLCWVQSRRGGHFVFELPLRFESVGSEAP